MKYITVFFTFVALLLNCSTAFSKDYHVEALIFENLKPGRTYEKENYQAPEEMSSNADHWFVETTLLNDAKLRLEESDNYRVINHLTWGQASLPLSRATAYRVAEKEITGWFKVYANDLLFINLDLDINGYRITEKRRIKLNEKHFFDHPKYGVLLQVSRLAKPKPQTDIETELKASK